MTLSYLCEELRVLSSATCPYQDDGDAALQDNQTFLSVLSKIKSRDQALYDGSTKLFPDELSDEEGSDKDAPAAKERPALLKDVLARQVWPPSLCIWMAAAV